MVWLKEIRSLKGQNCEEVAAVCGITRSAYTNIENGKRRPSVSVAKRIGAVLGFDWTKFFEDEIDKASGE